jgi:hypothetical protein
MVLTNYEGILMQKDIHINLESLKRNTLTESAVVKMAADIKYLLYHLMGPREYFGRNIRVTGNRSDLEKFQDVISKEKKYMDAYLKHGLNDSRVLNNRFRLEKAVYNFEKETGIKWPLK